MDEKKARILIAGASGYLGKHVVRVARHRDKYWVRVLVRSDAQARELAPFCDEVIVAQITDASSLAGIADTIDVVFSCVGITRQKDGASYESVDYRGNLNLLRESEAAGVSRFVYVSVFGGPANRQVAMIDAKERFVAQLESSSLSSCVIRPTGFFVDIQAFLDMARRGRVYVLGDGSAQMNPISGADLAVVCLDAMATNTVEINVGGPEPFSQNEIAQLAFKALGRRAKITHMPMSLVRAGFAIFRFFTSEQTYGAIEMFVSVGDQHMVAPAAGDEHLADWFTERVNNK